MALYLNDNRYALYTSVNLLRWELMQELTLPSDTECPDLYPLPVDGNKNNIKWVFSGASDRYLVGNISKGLYRPTQLSKRLHYGKNSYAAQTFSNIPEEDGRKIRIAWNTMETPNTYFNCSMCFPTEMTLKTLEGEESLCIWPVEEIKNLYKVTNTYADHTINHEQPLNIKLDGKGHDIELEITAHADSELRINLFGMDINCKVSENQVQFNNNTMPLFINQNKFKLRILVDTVGLEIFADQGQAHMCAGFLADYNLNLLEFKAVKGEIRIDKCKLSELTSIW
jgi:sucrose-6-phosphate hydrolase SacC (GH32 family)